MKGYKAFNPGLICRGKQYEENTVFEEQEAEICKSGMHFCENPFDVLDYYPLVNENGDFSDFAEVETDKAETDDNKKFCTKKLKIGAKLSFYGFIKACIDFCIEKTKFVPDASSGYGTQIGSSGDGAKIGSSGNGAQIGSSGDWAQIGSSGKNSVICCAGNGCHAKAKKGSWITLSEWGYNESGEYAPLCVKTEFVDGEKIKEDTFYMLKNGEFVETDG